MPSDSPTATPAPPTLRADALPDSALVLALDVGTSSARCLGFDLEGRQVVEVDADRQVSARYTADGGAELDAPALLEASVACLEAASAQAKSLGRTVLAVGVCTFWHNVLGVDAQGQPITPILLWNDTRSAGAAARLLARLDAKAVHQRTGCVLHMSFLPARLEWLRETQPERFRAADAFMSFGEYIERQLFGARRCSLSMASGSGLLNQQALTWDAELLETLQVGTERLNPLLAGHEPLQGLQAPWADRLPHLREVPFFPALGDGACNNLGSGATQPGVAALMVGTSAAMRLFFHGEAPPAPQGLWRYLLDPGRILIGGALSNGGSLFAWLQQTLRLPADVALEAALAQAAPDGHGLTVLPFILGERNPDYPLEATGTLTGLRATTTPTEIVQAGLEAVAYRLAAIADRLRAANPELHRYLASGGLQRSPAWVRMMADVLGLPVAFSTVREASARGAALMAVEGLGLPAPDAAADAQGRDLVEPDMARHARYAEARERHEALYRQFIRSSVE